MLRSSLFALAWLGCGGEVAPPPAETAPVPFEEALQAQGFALGEGVFVPMVGAECCQPGAECTDANPATPFASFELPTAADQLTAGPASPATHHVFRMRADEAIVFLGTTPPEVPYFSFRSYLWAHAGDPTPVFGQLGPGLHVQSAPPGPAGSVFDQPIAIVTTMDAGIEATIVDALVGEGWPTDRIHLDRIPAGEPLFGVRPGVDDEADQFAMIVRIAVQGDFSSLGDWVVDPGQVYRITPIPGRPTDALHTAEVLPAPTADGDEASLADAVDALGEAIRAAYAPRVGEVQAVEPWVVEPYTCLSQDEGCQGASTDALDHTSAPFELDDDAFVVVYGVNHSEVGRATYHHMTVEGATSRFGSVDRIGAELLGSARGWGAELGNVDPDLLYAYVVARTCSTALHSGRRCVEIVPFCPGIPFGEEMQVRWRAYLDPDTITAPPLEAILKDRALFFAPSAP